MERIADIISLGIIFMFEISTIAAKHMTALAGMKIVSKGICTITCKVVIISQSFFIDTPIITERKIFEVIAPVKAEPAESAAAASMTVAAKKLGTIYTIIRHLRRYFMNH